MPYSPAKFTGAQDAQCLQGMPYSPAKFTGAQDAQCLQGMPYSPAKFTGAQDAQCSQGMRYSPVKFSGAPDAQCLQGMPYSQAKFAGAPDAQCLQGMPYSPVKFTGHKLPDVCRGCHIPRRSSPGTRCPMFAGDAVFPGDVHRAQDAQCLQGMPYSPAKFTGYKMPNVCNVLRWHVLCIGQAFIHNPDLRTSINCMALGQC